MLTKRILVIEPCGKVGIIHYTHHMCNELARLGHKILLITAIEYETKNTEKNYRVLEVFDGFTPHLILVADAFRKIFKLNPSIIHLQGAIHPGLYYILILLLKCVSDAKIVYTAHEVFMIGKKKHSFFINFLLKRLFASVDKIIVHADSAKSDIINFFQVDKNDVHTLPMGTSLIAPQGTADEIDRGVINQENRNLQILFFGIIEPKKGLIYLIRAFAKVVKEIKNVNLIIAGKPFEDISHYIEEIQFLNISSSVECFFQYIPLEDVSSYFISADIVVAPYTHACQSAVIATAFNFSKPVISSDCGGLPELVKHGESGLVVPVEDVDKLAAAIVTLLKDTDLRWAMGRNAGRISKEKHSWETIVVEIEKIYVN